MYQTSTYVPYITISATRKLKYHTSYLITHVVLNTTRQNFTTYHAMYNTSRYIQLVIPYTTRHTMYQNSPYVPDVKLRTTNHPIYHTSPYVTNIILSTTRNTV